MVLGITFCLSGVSYIALAEPEVLDDKHIDQIKANCVLVDNTLNQLHTSDALLRVNRGQVYESIQTKLMVKLNARLANNKIDNKELIEISNQYKAALNQFRTDYVSYEEQLTKAIDIDCQAQPQLYYQTILSVRDRRKLVHADIVNLNQQIDKYALVVDNLGQQLKPETLED